MALLGRNGLIYRVTYPSNLSVSPPTGQTLETFTGAERCDAGEKARVTYNYSSNANITSFKAVWSWLDAAGGEISRNEVTLTPNTSGTRTDEYTAPEGTVSFKFGIKATSGASQGTASATNIKLRLSFGMAKNCSASLSADLIKEYVIGSDTPAVLESGNKTVSVSFDLIYMDEKYGSKVLDGDVFDVVIAPDGWGTGKPLITLQNVKLNSWDYEMAQDGVIVESVSGEASNISFETQ